MYKLNARDHFSCSPRFLMTSTTKQMWTNGKGDLCIGICSHILFNQHWSNCVCYHWFACPIWPLWLNPCGKDLVLMESAAIPIPRVRGPNTPIIFGTTINADTIWAGAMKLGTVTNVGRCVRVSGVNHIPSQAGGTPWLQNAHYEYELPMFSSNLHKKSFVDQALYVHVWIPRDAVRKCGLCCHPVYVRLSVTLVDCI